MADIGMQKPLPDIMKYDLCSFVHIIFPGTTCASMIGNDTACDLYGITHPNACVIRPSLSSKKQNTSVKFLGLHPRWDIFSYYSIVSINLDNKS